MHDSPKKAPPPHGAPTTLRPRTEPPTTRRPGDPARTPVRYAHGPVSFLPPAEWRSVAVFSAPPGPTARALPTVSVTREALSPGETLGSHADHLVTSVRAAAPGFDLLERSALTVAGHPALRLRFGLEGPAGPIEQTMVIVEPVGDGELTTFGASGPRHESPAMRETMDALLASVRFATPPAPTPPPPHAPVESYVAELMPSVPMPGYRPKR